MEDRPKKSLPVQDFFRALHDIGRGHRARAPTNSKLSIAMTDCYAAGRI
jgi:hypothetical protein